MLQVTANIGNSALGAVVNSCLFSSLVFSVGSAVNSLLSRSWRNSIVWVTISTFVERNTHRANSRDPDTALSVGLKVWLNAGPMVSLLVSGAFFTVGICAFVFTPGQVSTDIFFHISSNSISCDFRLALLDSGDYDHIHCSPRIRSHVSIWRLHPREMDLPKRRRYGW